MINKKFSIFNFQFSKNFVIYGIVFVMLAIMAFLLIKNARDDSATTDEPVHILSGYEYLKGIYTVNPEHPPLGKMFSAIPLNNIKPYFPKDGNFEEAIRDYYYYDSWNETRIYAHKWLYDTPGNNPDEIVASSRMVVVIFTIILGLILFLVAKHWYGIITALISLFLYSFSPLILTHGHLANTDLWAMLGFFTAIFGFAWYIEKPENLRLFISALLLSFALLVKFSLVLVVPIMIILWYIKYLKSGKDKKYSFKKILVTALIYFVVSFGAIWIVYGFPINTAPAEIVVPNQTANVEMLQKLSPIMDHLPLPEYLKGLIMVVSTSLSHRPAYILGNYYSSGVWYYFPFAFLVKEPLSLLIMLFGGIIYWVTTRRKLEFRDWVLIVPVGIYFIVSIFSKLNIGIRHLMPIYPFIFIFIGYFVSELYEKITYEKKLLTAYGLLLMTLFSWYLYANISVYPYYMTYFNELAGGPKNGGKLLADSNIDWGQDMKRLSNWVRENNITEPIRMEYFWSGKLQPKYYGINFIELEKNNPNQKGWIAIGKSAMYMPEYNWLNNYDPYTTIGNSIKIYYIK